MIFLLINSSGKSEAIIEIVLILSIAALLGYVISKLLVISKLRLLREEIEQKQTELAERRSVIIEQPVPAIKPAVTKVVTTMYPATPPVESFPQDLKIIEGIGPKIEEILNKHGINNYATLVDTSPVRIAAILRSAGPRYQIHDPSSWPRQAECAKSGNWKELEEIKTELFSGRVS